MNEVALVEWIKQHAATPRTRDLILGIGDDCAILRPRPNEDLLLKTDPLIEGVHFTSDMPGEVVGARAIARNLSDIAAMGGEPRYCLVSLAVGPNHNERWIKAFFRGLLRQASKTNTFLIGGDLSHSTRETHTDITLCGAVPQGKALRRDGAKPGDAIYVSGKLGKPWTRPIKPNLELGKRLRSLATSCMDLSDGLSLDLTRLCKASNVSAHLNRIPIFKGATLDRAMNGGEDYELLFTIPKNKKAPSGCYRIGTVSSGSPGEVFLDGNLLSPKGYDHFS